MEPEDVAEVKRRHPGAQIVAHGECRAELLAMADYVGSTSGIIQYVTASDCQEFIVCTEEGVGYKLKEQNPEKTFYYPGQATGMSEYEKEYAGEGIACFADW